MSDCVYSVKTQVFLLFCFFSSLFPKFRCLCHSLARRGQPCIMSALTAVQLDRIQSLDKSFQKPSGTIHMVFFQSTSPFNTDQIKLWIEHLLLEHTVSSEIRFFEAPMLLLSDQAFFSQPSWALLKALCLFGAVSCVKMWTASSDSGYFTHTQSWVQVMGALNVISAEQGGGVTLTLAGLATLFRIQVLLYWCEFADFNRRLLLMW